MKTSALRMEWGGLEATGALSGQVWTRVVCGVISDAEPWLRPQQGCGGTMPGWAEGLTRHLGGGGAGRQLEAHV